MSQQSILTLLVLFKIGCMVNMGNSSSTRVPREEIYNDNISDVSIACIKAHLKSGRPAKEFRILENEIPSCEDTITEAQRICNKEKNRYVNILPCDSTRVRLTPIAGVDGSDYINANFIDGELSGTERAYIATQGPLMHTRADFWRMVWENNTNIVVMLGKEKENDRVKVDRYWPEEGEGPLHFYNLSVQLVAKEYDPELSIAVRRLILTYDPHNPAGMLGGVQSSSGGYHEHCLGSSSGGLSHSHGNGSGGKQTRTVTHYQYEGWPDHGVPPSAAPIRHLVRLIERERMNEPPQQSPMVVHCSAGVGRTGTFVTIHMTLLRLYHELMSNNTNNPLNNSTNGTNNKNANGELVLPPTATFNLYNTVLKLRRQRPGMVQQQEQYVFCY